MTAAERRKPRLGMLVGSIDDEAGGVAQAVRSLASALQRRGLFEIEIFSLGTAAIELTIEDVPVHVSRILGPDALSYAPRLLSSLKNANLDCLHVHGLWQYISIAARIWAQRTGRPYIVSPHGMLDEWALANRGWKKRLACAFYEDAHLNAAMKLHALCEPEAQSILKAGYHRPTVVIPNGVDVHAAQTAHPQWRLGLPEQARVLLFLGRVTPKKRVAALINAWAKTRSAVSSRDWHLVIVGPISSGYGQELDELVSKNRLAASVHFTGPAYGEDRSRAYAAANAFILPSISEGLPMAILEAFSFGLPVLMTPQCNIPEGFATDAAMAINPDEDSIGKGLLRLFTMDRGDLSRMAENGLHLTRTHFNWNSVAAAFEAVYSECISGTVSATGSSTAQPAFSDKLRLSSLT